MSIVKKKYPKRKISEINSFDEDDDFNFDDDDDEDFNFDDYKYDEENHDMGSISGSGSTITPGASSKKTNHDNSQLLSSCADADFSEKNDSVIFEDNCEQTNLSQDINLNVSRVSRSSTILSTSKERDSSNASQDSNNSNSSQNSSSSQNSTKKYAACWNYYLKFIIVRIINFFQNLKKFFFIYKKI